MCITGEAGGFQHHFGAEKKEKKNGNNIAMFQRRDVAMFNRIKKSTSDVVTSQCRDVIAISASES